MHWLEFMFNSMEFRIDRGIDTQIGRYAVRFDGRDKGSNKAISLSIGFCPNWKLVHLHYFNGGDLTVTTEEWSDAWQIAYDIVAEKHKELTEQEIRRRMN